MDKKEIETRLRQNGFTRNSKSYQDYERAKEIFVRGPMSPREYSFRIEVITDYLKV